jgi:EamA domain-containing membrane protein RarD
MKKISFAVGSAYTAILAFMIVCIDQLIKDFMPIGADKGFTYIAFVAWAVYFFSGCTGKGGIRAAIGYVIGVTFSVGIILLSNVFAATGFFAVPIAVLIVVFFVLYLEKLPWVDLIPAMFVASGCYFGIMTYVDQASFGTAAFVEIVYGFIGLLFGWITITGKSYFSKMIEK